MLDLRFPTALQAMLSLALAHEQGIPRLASAELAEGLGANPTLVRRLLAHLGDCGLLNSTLGKGGGVSLARPAREISLAEIYAAATGGRPLWVARNDIPHRCVVTSNIEHYFTALAGEAEAAISRELSKSTLAEALVRLKQLNGSSTARPTRRRRAASRSA